MNPTAIVTIAILGAAGASLAITEFRSPTPPPAAPGPDVAALQQELGKLRAEIADLRRAPPPQTATTELNARTAVPMLSDEQIAGAIERYLATHGDNVAANAALTGG